MTDFIINFPSICSTFSAFGKEFRIYSNTPESVIPSSSIHFGETPSITSATPPHSIPAHSLIVSSPDHDIQLPTTSELEHIPLPPALGSSMLFDPSSSTAVLTIPDEPPEKEPAARALYTALPLFVYSCLKQSGIFFIHAAAAARDGIAVIFIGANESGKSTLAKSLLLHGWDIISDDNLPLHLSHGSISARQNREAFNSKGFTPAELEQLTSSGCTPAAVAGFLIPPRLSQKSFSVGAVIYPQWKSSPSHPEKTPIAAALKHIYSSCKTPLSQRDLPDFDSIASALAFQSTHYSLGILKGCKPDLAILLTSIETA